MSPLAKHEQYKHLLSDIVRLISYEMEIDVQSLGSTTFTEEWLDKGVEPDTCFYVVYSEVGYLMSMNYQLTAAHFRC